MRYIIYILTLTLLPLSHLNAQLSGESFETEKEAILEVIKTETDAYFHQDLDAWSACFVHAPYMQRVGYWEGYENKISQSVGWAEYSAAKTKQWNNSERKKSVWDNSTWERTDYTFRIYENMAWVSFTETSYGADGQFLGKALSNRIMEKHEGKWKIAFIGFYYYPISTNEN